jgi:hypothetical protein
MALAPSKQFVDRIGAIGRLASAAPHDIVLEKGAKSLKDFGLKPRASLTLHGKRYMLYDQAKVAQQARFVAECVESHGSWNPSFLKWRPS